MPLKIVVPRTLSPKCTKMVNTPKSLMISEKLYKNEPSKLNFAAGVDGVPPEGDDNMSSFIKKEIPKDVLKKIVAMTKDINRYTRKAFDIFKNNSKCTK